MSPIIYKNKIFATYLPTGRQKIN